MAWSQPICFRKAILSGPPAAEISAPAADRAVTEDTTSASELDALRASVARLEADVADLKVDFQIEELRENLREVRSPPPRPR